MGEEEREERDETRATFAPVHRPQPPQIVKSCLQLSEILIFSDESFPSYLFSLLQRKHSKAHCSSIIFRHFSSSNFKVNAIHASTKYIYLLLHTLLHERTHARKVYSCNIRVLFPSHFPSPHSLFRVIQRSCPHATKFCRLIEKFSRVQSHELTSTAYYSCFARSPPHVRIKPRIPYRGHRFRASFPVTMISRKV